MAEGPCVSLIASRLYLAPALVIWMVKKRLVIRALERPAECREEGGGGREGSWMVDSDGDDVVVLTLFCFFHMCGLRVLIEGNSSFGRISERAPEQRI